jgi:ribosomal protein S18 acetylase RimI-like enzyme
MNTNQILEIKRLQNADEAATCARMMARSEPWITLKRDYTAALEIINDPMREVYIAVRNGEIVGFIVIILRGAFIGYIQSICVAPEWRNRGIGGQLMAYAERRIFNESPNVFICVSSFNKSALRLYERLGYETIGELKDYVISGYSEILMRKTIGSLKEFKKRDQAFESVPEKRS